MKKTKQHIFAILFVLAVSMMAAGGVSASDGRVPALDDEVVFFGTYTLDSGEELSGSLIVFGGVVSLEEDSSVTGDVLIFGGNVTASGEVDGNLVAIGGVVSLRETAVVRGDLIAPATVVRRDENARILGQIITENIPMIDVPEIPEPDTEIPEFPSQEPTFFDRFLQGMEPVFSFFAVIARSLIFSAVAVLIGLVLPKQSQIVRETIEAQPVLSGGFGLLSVGVFVAAVVMLSLLSITVILIPLTVPLIVLLSLAFALGLLFGLVVMGNEIGRRMMAAFKQNWTPTLQTALGSFSMAFVLGLLSIGFWGFMGGLLWTLIGAIGLGSVLLTRFGTQRYTGSAKPGKPKAESALIEEVPADEPDVEDLSADVDEVK